MINLRYHIVSITAVFLALGIGITLGSTFIGRETLDQIRNNVDSARNERNQTRAENEELRRQLDLERTRGAGLTEEGVKRLFEGRLEDVPVLLVASPGIDGDSLDAMSEAVNDSASNFLGTLTVEPKVQLEGDGVEDMAAALDATLRDPERLRDLATKRLAQEMRGASAPGENGAEPPASTLEPGQQSAVGSLIDAGFLSYEGGDSDTEPGALLTGKGYRYVVVTGPTPDVPDETFMLPLVQALASDRPAQAVVAAAATGEDAEEVRAATLQPYLDDATIAQRISTVDSLDDFSGIAAVMLSLEDLAVDQRGHYGYSEGRTQLPAGSG